MSLRRWRAATLPCSHSDGRSPWANIRPRPQCAAWSHSHSLRARTVHARCAGSGRATRPGDAVESAVSRGGVFVQGASGLLPPLCVHRTHWIVKDAVRIHQLAPPTSFRCYELSVRTARPSGGRCANSIARTEDRDPICLWRFRCLKPRLFSNRRRTRTVSADSNSTPSGLASQKVEHTAQNRPSKRRVKIEDRAAGQVRHTRILLDEPDPVQIQRLCALPGAFDIGRLKFNPNARSAGTNRDKQGNMAQPGAKVDQNIAGSKRSQADQTEDMARRGGLIKHHLRLPLCVPVVRLFELQHSADQLIKIVIAHAAGGTSLRPDLRSRIDPLKQTTKPPAP